MGSTYTHRTIGLLATTAIAGGTALGTTMGCSLNPNVARSAAT
jgi:hypothetical protein